MNKILLPNSIIGYFNRSPQENTRVTDFWCSSDNPNLYKINREKMGESWFYKDTEESLTYTFNSQGHRNALDLQDFPEDYGLGIGCSLTAGVGIHKHDTFLEQVSEKIHVPIYNAGIPAASNEIGVFNLLSLITIKKPQFVIFQITQRSRLTHKKSINNYSPINVLGSWTVKNKSIALETKETQTVPQNSENMSITHESDYFIRQIESGANNFKHLLSIHMVVSICQLLHIPLILIEGLDTFIELPYEQKNYVLIDKSYFKDPLYFQSTHKPECMARDLIHPGPQANERLANIIIEKLDGVRSQY